MSSLKKELIFYSNFGVAPKRSSTYSTIIRPKVGEYIIMRKFKKRVIYVSGDHSQVCDQTDDLNIIREIKEQRHSLEFITELLTDLISQIDVLKIQNTLPSKESVFDDFLAFKDKTLLDFYKPSLIALINE